MANENIIGRMRCPCCGEEMQDVKVNKNGNLYMICDNSCRVNFSPKQTRKFKPVLLSGRNISENGLYITSIKGVTNGTGTAETAVRTSTTAGTITGTKPATGTTGNPVIRRTDGQPAAAGNGDAKPASRAGGFINWLNSDDE